MSKDEVYHIVQEIIMEILPDVEKENIAIEKQLKDIGANSIDRMEIVTMSMRELNIKIPLMSFAGVNNIEGLVNVLHENVNN
ncbi:acyl carrier protein [Kordia algicida OT-1]|uniref:Acyl carrier protein n=1 Tax=Kordia algicida OT-1 TaxID=391587 RepID=A9EAD8_9FLAO|nr:acyl carrier protein [Kordia algicida]EDP94618.1 acyl carrier protein [Kordia algicida OT-1]